jgi:hypothetical protein
MGADSGVGVCGSGSGGVGIDLHKKSYAILLEFSDRPVDA